MTKLKYVRKRWRLEKTVQKSPAAAATESPCHFQAFGSVQSLGKAIKRAEKALPCSPRKKSAVVKKLAVKFGFHHVHRAIRDRMPKELVKTIQEFYESDTVSQQLTGKKDCITAVSYTHLTLPTILRV